MKENHVQKAYEIARERYAAVGVDTDKVLDQMQDFHLSMHCWQADDVAGFEPHEGGLPAASRSTATIPARLATLASFVMIFSTPCRSSPASTA